MNGWNKDIAKDNFMKPIDELVRFLEEKAVAVRDLEAEADRLLNESGDQEGYRERMRDKAALLAALSDEARGLVRALEPEVSGSVGRRLEAFSSSASSALNIGSVFYMYALLYPEDHRPGEMNDLEAFIHGLGSGL